MKLIRSFKSLGKKDISLAGGKGASLGEMMQAGFPVPPGFVVLADAFEQFLTETDLNVEISAILKKVNCKDINSVDKASNKIRDLIADAKFPKNIGREIKKEFKKLGAKFVAVRSSATAEDSSIASWAGELESYLNVDEMGLLEAVKKCWSSLFTPRAIFYRFEKNLHEQKVSVAVVVQAMIQSEISGIAFSVHPITQDKNQLIIEAGFGLGEAIVSGQITPDSYVIEKQPRRIIDKNVQMQSRGFYRGENGGNEWRDITKKQGEKQVLADKKILKLSNIILLIERHYEFPVDVEWAEENDKFYITQSRPITTLNNASNNYIYSNFFKKISDDLFKVVKIKVPTLSAYCVTLASTKNFIKENDFGLEKDQALLFVDPQIYLDGNVYRKRKGSNPVMKWVKNDYTKIGKFLINAENKLISYLTKESGKLYKINPKKLSREKLSQVLDNYFNTYQKAFPLINTSIILEQYLTPILHKLINKEFNDKEKVFQIFTTPLKKSNVGKKEEEISRLASCFDNLSAKEKNTELNKLVERYSFLGMRYFGGHPLNKKDLSRDLNEKNNKIDKDSGNPEDKFWNIYNRIKSRGLKNLVDFIQILTIHKTERLDNINRASLIFRDFYKNKLEKVLNIKYDDFIYLTTLEISKLILDDKYYFSELIKKRKLAYGIFQFNNKLVVIDDLSEIYQYINLIEKSASSDEGIIRGQAAQKGIVEGCVKIVRGEEDFKNFKKGEIMVTEMTTPDFVPFMKRALAIITDLGGITSHAAIISRELKIPCIIGTKIATQILKNGDVILVDADNGIVRKVK